VLTSTFVGRSKQGCFLWIWEDLLKSYTDAKVAYATRRLEAENVALAASGAAAQARCEEEVEELQARQDEEVAELQTRHEKEIDGIQAELAGAKANARKLKIVIACLVLFCMLRM
jgi:hypothetical protein